MPFCPSCGQFADSSASFCTNCGTSVKTGIPPTSQVSMKEHGGILEDSIANYFRNMKF